MNKALGREPFQVVEVITPKCVNVHGSAPCTATETGDAKCFNTRATCNDVDNFQGTPLGHLTATEILEEFGLGEYNVALNDTQPCTIAVDLRLNADPDGCIVDIGPTTRGMYLGITDGDFVFRAGDTSTSKAGNTNGGRVAADATPYIGQSLTVIGILDFTPSAACKISLFVYDPVELKLTMLGEDTFTGTADWIDGGAVTRIGSGSSAAAGESVAEFNGAFQAYRLYVNTLPVMGQACPSGHATLKIDAINNHNQRNGWELPLSEIVEFTRAGPAKFIGSNGRLQEAAVDVPRLEYKITPTPNGDLIEPRGWLWEAPKLNRFNVGSDDIKNWDAFNMVVEDSLELGPDGVTPCYKARELASTGSAVSTYIRESMTGFASSIGDRHIGSIMLKALEHDFANIWIMTTSTNRAQATINLNTGEVTNILGVAPGIEIAAYADYYGDGWWRPVVSAEDGAGITSGNVYMHVFPYSEGQSQVRDGDGVSGILVCNPMYEFEGASAVAGAVASSYIEPGVTRQRDQYHLKGGDWYDEDRQVWVIDFETRVQKSGANSEGLGIIGVLGHRNNGNKTILYGNSGGSNSIYNSWDGSAALSTPAIRASDDNTAPATRHLVCVKGDELTAASWSSAANGTLNSNNQDRDFSGADGFWIGGRLGQVGATGFGWLRSLRYAPDVIDNDLAVSYSEDETRLPDCDQSDAYRQRYFFDDGRKAKPSNDLYLLPMLADVQTVGTKLNVFASDDRYEPLGRRAFAALTFVDAPHTDFQFDPYLVDRTFDPLTRSTFWPKWLARNKFGKTRAVVRLYHGYDGQALADVRKQTYVLDKVDWSRESLNMNCRDYLSLTEFRRAQVPAPSPGKLALAMDTVQTTMVLDGDQRLAYPAPGTIRIQDELMTYTGSSYDVSGDLTTLTGLTRATDGSEAEEHDVDDGVQLCRRYTGAKIDDVLEDLIINDAGVPGQLVDIAGIKAEVEEFLNAYALTTVISEPTGVDQLVGEIAEQCSFYVWWDERDQIVKMQAIKPLGEVTTVLSQEQNIIGDSFEIMERPKERVSLISMFYNPRNFAGDLQKPVNFKNQLLVANSAGSDPDQYGKLGQTREVFSRWLTTEAQMNQTGSRLSVRYADVPTDAGLMVDAKDDEIWVGDFVRLSHDFIINPDGSRDDLRRWLVIEAETVEPGHSQRLGLKDVTLDGEIYFITVDGIGGDEQFTPELFALNNAFITDNDGLNSDGTVGATIG